MDIENLNSPNKLGKWGRLKFAAMIMGGVGLAGFFGGSLIGPAASSSPRLEGETRQEHRESNQRTQDVMLKVAYGGLASCVVAGGVGVAADVMEKRASNRPVAVDDRVTV